MINREAAVSYVGKYNLRRVRADQGAAGRPLEGYARLRQCDGDLILGLEVYRRG